MLVPQVPQMWYKCGTKKRPHTFFGYFLYYAPNLTFDDLGPPGPKGMQFYVCASSASNEAQVRHGKVASHIFEYIQYYSTDELQNGFGQSKSFHKLQNGLKMTIKTKNNYRFLKHKL